MKRAVFIKKNSYVKISELPINSISKKIFLIETKLTKRCQKGVHKPKKQVPINESRKWKNTGNSIGTNKRKTESLEHRNINLLEQR